MNISVLDFETTFQIENKKKNPTPYDPKNYLVSYGIWSTIDDELYYQCIKHNEKATDDDAVELLQDILDSTDILVAFNVKFELEWLRACGFRYTGKVMDPMLMAYVLARGQKLPLDLASCCIRYNVAQKKSELVEEYLKKNIGFEEIPWDTVEEYGRADVVSARDLYFKLVEILNLNENKHLWPTVNLMCEFSKCLAEIEHNGIQIDITELDRLEKEYTKELNELKLDLQVLVKEVMGATPINLDSPEQLSQVLYSRRVINKDKWKEIFNLGTEKRGSVIKPKHRPKMSITKFVDYVKEYTEIVHKTVAERCPICLGKGYFQKVRTDGTNYKRQTGCQLCRMAGVVYIETKEIAGFKFIPSGASDVAIGGFTTDGDTLDKLKEKAKGSAREFIDKIGRISSITTYLSAFIGGIRRGLRNENILHASFMQHVTATGRLSGRNPNTQNMPRNNTFPVRKCIISRFGPEGLILSGDAKQLEFRIAGELSGDEQIFEDVIAGIDVHANTAAWTGLNRQDSKPYTFAPVYGASDRGKPEHIAAYFKFFQSRYAGLFRAHKSWQERVLEHGSYRLPSGREFIYPGTIRYPGGGVSNSTIIANYPVQAFATSDLMPIFCINTWKLYQKHNLKSLVILEVHDDVTVDVYPGELKIAAELMVEAFNSLPEECIKRYNYELKMPLEIELKVGASWYAQKEYKG